MAGGVTVSIADPDVRTVETTGGTWILSGLRSDRLESVVREADTPSAVRRHIPGRGQDGMLICVEDDSTIHAFRTAVGTRSVYLLRGSTGEAVLTDHFRNALARLAVDDRYVGDESIADHLLYRAPIPPSSPVDGIDLLGQGEWVTWDLVTGERDRVLVDQIDVDSRRSPDEGRTAIDETLADVLALDGDLVTLYSGGVDSTLTQTYLDDEAQMLNIGVDSPEYAFELEYAETGSELLDSPLDQIVLPEETVLELIEGAIDSTGLPYHPFQSALMEAAFSYHSGKRYVMAIGADSLFGNENVHGARRAALFSPLLTRSTTKPLIRAIPGKPGSYLQWLQTLAEQQRRPDSHPRSFPHDWTYTNPDLVDRLLSPALVQSRARKLSSYVDERVERTEQNGYVRAVEMAQLTEQLGNRSGALWRQFASAHGNSLVTPFEARGLFNCSLSIPAERRYLADGKSKYLLKRLLNERLPAYPTDQEKGAGILPFGRYMENGVLGDVFESYDVPSFVPRGRHDEILRNTGRQAWNIITYAIWEERVLTKPVEPVPTSTTLEW